MGRKSKFIEILTAEQKASLQKGYSHGKSPFFRRRCHCILQSNKGKTTKQLGSFFQVNTLTILSWFISGSRFVKKHHIVIQAMDSQLGDSVL